MASFKLPGMGGGEWLGMATIQLPQPSKAGTWAELGNMRFQLSHDMVHNRKYKIKHVAMSSQQIPSCPIIHVQQ